MKRSYQTTTPTVHVTKTGNKWIVRIPYDPDLVDAIKRGIPSWAREYNPHRRHWVVDNAYIRALLTLLEYDHGVTVVGYPSTPPPRSQPEQVFDWAGAFIQRVGYREAAKLLHPDTGGDTTLKTVLMAELNEARSVTQ